MNDTNAQPEEPQKHDKDAFDAIFEQHAPRLYTFALRLCHEPTIADQIVGEAFAQLLGEFSTGKGHSPDPRLSFYRTAYNSCVAYLREHPQGPAHGPSLEATLHTPLTPERASPWPVSFKPGKLSRRRLAAWSEGYTR